MRREVPLSDVAGVFASACLLLSACADAAAPPSPVPVRPNANATGDPIPEPYIYWYRTALSYYGGEFGGVPQVETFAQMQFRGNKGKHEVELRVTGEGGTGLTHRITDPRSYVYDPNTTHTLTTRFWSNLPDKCGLSMSGATSHYAWFEVYNPAGPPGLSGTALAASSGSSAGPTCPPPEPGSCEDTRIYEDPDDPPPECDGAGGGDGGGETSTCITEYICIDLWNEETGTWNEYWCGYASIC